MIDYEHVCDHNSRFVSYPEDGKPFCARCEIKRLRLLIRCETITPPSDVTDDCTTELAVELAVAKAEIERLTARVDYLKGCKKVAANLEKGFDELRRADKAEIERLTRERDERENDVGLGMEAEYRKGYEAGLSEGREGEG